ncbi:Ca-activated chloride channel family protein [Poseidonocella pacifica]|uniref:Ca-activated chloride channel family protein n=1 Tax=Poseidonocella pacifica TaxID=871651 RepID=A0A1I0YFS1_9RHOB|nr:VWA domain-containing protein [Poseidonocella pacifica]SFB12209.1 Ca-activated chloride channel family protein [Poseidonocella pacifica]
MIELAAPLALLLLPVPLLAVRLMPGRRHQGPALAVPDSVGRGLLADAGTGGRLPRARDIPLWAAWLCLVLALAGPRDLLPIPALKVSGRDLAIALDLSGSMVRDDFYLNEQQITRLDAVKHVGADFARRRAGDRVALIVFGSDAYYAAPFSYDTEAIARRIEEATIGISGRATNISDALGLALKRMEQSDAATKVVILLSDGVSNAGATNPRGVARLAADMGVRVHTIALGPKDTETAEAGENGVVDAATLRAISDLSGGTSFRVRTTQDLEAVAEELDRLEATAGDGLAAEVYQELWVYPAALAALLCLWIAWRPE